MDRCKPWVCQNCGHEIATVINGEAWFCGRVILRPESVLVSCPDCGALNPWHLARDTAKVLGKSTEPCYTV